MIAKTGEALDVPSDIATVAGIASIAYIISVALHEHAGHGLACAVLGGSIREWGAFYVDCDYQGMGDLAIRLVALAGPLVSLLLGIVAFDVLGRIRQATAPTKLLFWLLGSIGWMTATGYLLFSGVSGLGDFGTSRDGVLYALQPEWLWRVGATVMGLFGYGVAIVKSVQGMERIIGGSGMERVRRAQKLALTSYLTGGLVSFVSGLLNPHGLVIVLTSAVASSFGGTSALAWEMMLMKRSRATGEEPLRIERAWRWIVAGFGVALLYALVFGPSITSR